MNKPFTRKKDLRTNLKGARTAAGLRNNKVVEVAVAAMAATEVVAVAEAGNWLRISKLHD